MRSLAYHSPRQISGCSVCLLIHKIAPSAYSLSEQKSHHCYIKNRQNLHFLNFCHNKSSEQSPYYAAVDCKSSVIYVEDFNGMLAVVAVPLKNAKIKSCSDYSRYYSDKHAVYQLVAVNIVTRRAFVSIQNCKHQACGYYYSVPVYMVSSY